jgi:hypothetical protein
MVKVDAPVGVETYARASLSISTTAGVGDGNRGVTLRTSSSAVLVEPNSNTDVGDCPTASPPAAEPYPCIGQITQPCSEHQNAGARGATGVAGIG